MTELREEPGAGTASLHALRVRMRGNAWLTAAAAACACQCALADQVQISLEPIFLWSTWDNHLYETYGEACAYSIATAAGSGITNVRCVVDRPPGWLRNGRLPGKVAFDWVDGGSNWTHGFTPTALSCPAGTTWDRPVTDYSTGTMIDVCNLVIQKRSTSPCACEEEQHGNQISVLADQKREYATDLPALAGGFSVERVFKSGAGDHFAWRWIHTRLIPSGPATGAVAGREWCLPYRAAAGGKTYDRCLPVIGYTATFAKSVLFQGGSDLPSELEVKASGVRTTDRRREFWQATGADGVLSYFLLDENNLLHRFDAAGALTSLTQPNGQQSVLTYPTAGNLPSSVQDSFGRTYAFQFDADGFMTGVVNAQGGGVSYQYVQRPDGECPAYSPACKTLSAVVYADGQTRQYLYNEPANAPALQNRVFLTGKLDELGSREATFTYDSSGRPISTARAATSDQFQVTYPTSGNTRTLLSPLGAAETIDFAVVGGYRRTTQRSHLDAGATVRQAFAYDVNGNVASSDDFNGSRTCSAYDLSRNLETARVEGLASTQSCGAVTPAGSALPAGSRKTSTVWHSDWRLEAKRAEPGKLTTSIYNGQPDPFNGNAIASCAPSTALLPDGKPIAVLCKQVEQATSDANGSQGLSASLQNGVASRTRSWAYNQYGQVLTETDPLNNTTSYAYYSDTTGDHTRGDLQSATNAKNQVTSYGKYNKHGQLLESTDPNGVLTVNTYDLRQRLLSTSVAGQTTSYDYDAAGQLLKVTSSDQSWIGYEYDAAHRQTAIKDNLGNRIEYALDNAGNKTGQSVKDPLGNLARSLARSIDALGRVQQTTGRE